MDKKEKNKQRKQAGSIRAFFSREPFQRAIIGVITLLAIFIIVSKGAAPKRYKVELNEKSDYDITAPRDIENTIKTEENAVEMAKGIPPIVKELQGVNTKIINSAYDFFDEVENLRRSFAEYGSDAEAFVQNVKNDSQAPSIIRGMSDDQLSVILDTDKQDKLQEMKNLITKNIIPQVIVKDITGDSLQDDVAGAQKKLAIVPEELVDIGAYLLKEIIEPNSYVDNDATEKAKLSSIEQYKKDNPVMIYKDERIISKYEVVTRDKLDILERLNYIDNERKVDYIFLGSMLMIILLLGIILAVYMRMFASKIYYGKNDIILLSVVMTLTVLLAWGMKEFLPEQSSYLTFTFIAPVLIAIFLDMKLAIFVNILLTLCISLMVKDNTTFIMMAIVNGTVAAYLSANASQRRKISLAGVIIGSLNVVVILCMGIFNRKEWGTLINEGGLAFINGLLSVILAIGLLPFLESSFNIITPLKLLELADPNQPLIKRLLMEAPGTYHHSLMVGNLAEVATRAIGGNALLARVGAYFHDIGKLKRPNFFRENQMSENPHDRMTPNLSTLVITSHTKDGEELAIKNKIPKAIRDIIVQHHGRTLVAYFYHKAKQGDKGEEVKEANFRYEGPLPDTREAAVVLLADSVEAAVRSMQDKTKGKIEGLIRKIIKDKLDDGQLDRCELTLKDLNDIANSFLTVLSGFFHERTEYPELEKREQLSQLDNQPYNINAKEQKGNAGEKGNEA